MCRLSPLLSLLIVLGWLGTALCGTIIAVRRLYPANSPVALDLNPNYDDFGVHEGGQVSRLIVLTNRGERSIHFGTPERQCSCTGVLLPDRLLLPGEKVVATVVLESSFAGGEFRTNITFPFTSGDVRGKCQYVATGRFVPQVSVAGPVVCYRDDVPIDVVGKINYGAPLKIVDAYSTHRDVSVSLGPVSQRGFILTITGSGNPPALKPLTVESAEIYIHTDSSICREVRVPVQLRCRSSRGEP